MIARAFRATAADRAGCLRWLAAGGVAVCPDPLATGSPAPWVTAGLHGWLSARVRCWDETRLRQFVKGMMVHRIVVNAKGTPDQWVNVVARPLFRSLRACASGAVRDCPGWVSPAFATGWMWKGITLAYPRRWDQDDVRLSGKWLVGGPDWTKRGSRNPHRDRPVYTWVSPSLADPNKGLTDRAVVPDLLLAAASLRVRAMKTWAVLTISGRPAAVGCKNRYDAIEAIGAAVLDECGHPGAVPGSFPADWVGFDPSPLAENLTGPDYSRLFRDRFNRLPTRSEFLEAGYA